METVQGGGGDDAVAGLIVADGNGQYFALASDDLQRYRVPVAWEATVPALVLGAEPTDRADDVWSQANTLTLSTNRPLLIEAVVETGWLRLAAQRLEAWALLR